MVEQLCAKSTSLTNVEQFKTATHTQLTELVGRRKKKGKEDDCCCREVGGTVNRTALL